MYKLKHTPVTKLSLGHKININNYKGIYRE